MMWLKVIKEWGKESTASEDKTGLSGWFLHELSRNKFVKNAGDERLIGEAFLDGSSLEFNEIFLRNPDVDSLVLTKGGPSIFLIAIGFLFDVRNRPPFIAFDGIKDLFIVLIYFHVAFLPDIFLSSSDWE